MRKTLFAAAAFAAAFPIHAAVAEIPDLVGTWKGQSEQINAKWEYAERENVISIIEQKGRRFFGSVTHAGVTEKFVGVIRSDNKTFYWVDVEDEGRVDGVILGPDKIETCYLEAGDHAIAGCSVMTRMR